MLCKFVYQRSRRIVLGALLLVLAVSAFSHAQTVQQSALQPKGPVAQMQHDLFMWTVWVAAAIFIVVGGLLVFVIFRYRRRAGDALPKQIQGNNALEITWTIIPIILIITIAVPTVRGLFYMDTLPEGDAVNITVTGHQWWWEFEYPDYGIVTANEMVIPVGKVINLTLRSNDVIHSFWVPNLAGKTDTNPGQDNFMWLQADEPGVYHGQCAEYCGIAHANMRLRVIAETEDGFDAWLAGWETAVTEVSVAEADLSEVALRGQESFNQFACFACHAIDGTDFKGNVGPNLTRFGTRSTVAAGLVDNTPENLAAWIRNPQAIKPGNQMPALNVPEEDIQAIVAYLHSLQ